MAALFSRKKENHGGPGITDLDNILGHVDELVTLRISVQLSWNRSEARANLLGIEEKEKRLRFSSLDDINLASGSQVTVGFPLDGTWMEFKAPVFRQESGLYLGFPSLIQANERRSALRSSFSPREEASAALLESFGKGIGIQGSLDNVSSDACCVTVQRALDLTSEREVRFHENLLKTGQEFMLCRLKGIPSMPQIECPGKVIRVARRGGWQLVLELVKLGSDIRNRLDQFTQSRTMPYQPSTRSYKKKLELRAEKERAEKKEEIEKRGGEEAKPESPPPKAAAPVEKTETKSPPQAQPEPSPRTREVEMPVKLIRRLQDGPSILTLGDEINRDLSFFSQLGSHWKPCASAKELILTLQNLKQAILIIPKELNGQSVLDYMVKLSATGAMEHITLFLLAESGLSPDEIHTCKRVRVKRVFPFPLSELEPLLSAILSVQTTP